MRPRYKPPMQRRYFHKKRKIDRKDMSYLKKRISLLNKKKTKKELKKKEKLFL
jgi:hypothetical protein